MLKTQTQMTSKDIKNYSTDKTSVDPSGKIDPNLNPSWMSINMNSCLKLPKLEAMDSLKGMELKKPGLLRIIALKM